MFRDNEEVFFGSWGWGHVWVSKV